MLNYFTDPVFLIKAFGLIGVWFIVFSETGLLIGMFFPGDSLLFTAGLLASQGYLNIFALAIGAWIFAILGDAVGYVFGYRLGPKIFTKEDSLFFKKEYVTRAQKYFETYGSKTIIFSRFIPIVRTFAPILAGVGSMKYRIFTFYNVMGGFLWAVVVSFLGYFLGSIIPNIDKYLLPIILVIILVSFLPVVFNYKKIFGKYK